MSHEVEGRHSLKPIDSPYRRYPCQYGNPLGCDAFKTAPEADRLHQGCPICSFPTPLPEHSEIQGKVGVYRIEAWVGARSLGRLYRARLLGLNQTVVIKEYLLPPLHFNAEEIHLRQQTFAQVAGITLADGRMQDFRLLPILEAIADGKTGRCYLVLEEIGATPTLRQHLQQGAFSERQVHRVLQQGLQSLQFLHGQNFRLPSGQVAAGLTHGNLNLDSLLILASPTERESHLLTESPHLPLEDDFFIYLGDLNLWEHLFLPPLFQPQVSVPADDLMALGTVAFTLLSADLAKGTEQSLDPSQNSHWPTLEPMLKQFILRLMGVMQPFETATEALEAFYRLPLPPKPIHLEPVPVPLIEPARTQWVKPWVLVLLASLLGLGLLGWLVSFWLSRQSKLSAPPLQLCCLKEVAGVPQGTFPYTATADGIWRYVLQQKNLIRQGETLDGQLKLAHPQLNLKLEATTSIHLAMDNVRLGRATFAIAPLLQPLPEDLASETIAYDGVAILVAFSYTKREQSLPVLLNGRISQTQLAQIYAAQLEHWQPLGGSALPLKRYSPRNNELLEVFRTRIANQEPIAKPLPEFEMMRGIFRDFELRNSGSIGFASFSKVIGQCTVYPLAYQQKGQVPVQALQLKGGKTIAPDTDLCSKKGFYTLNPHLFRTGRYPLAYPIAVIYPRDNDRPPIGEKVAAMLKTKEGQSLLAATGLVPLAP
jgi:hypothetical protein